MRLYGLFHFQKITDLWGQDESGAVIPPVKLYQDSSSLFGNVFMNKVASLRDDFQLIFAYKGIDRQPPMHATPGGGDEPCIWPMMSSLSSRSVPARIRSLPPRAVRNFLLRPTNQPSQNGRDAAKSVLQVQADSDESLGLGRRSAGTDTRADV